MLGSSRRHPLRLASDRTTATGEAIDSGMDLAKTVSDLMKDVAKTMKDVPFVEGIAGIVLRIIQIRDEMKSKKDRCTELLNKVLRRTRTVFYAIKRVGEGDTKDDGPAIASLREELEAYHGILQEIHARLMKFNAKGTLSRILDRDKAIFEECNRLIDDFKDDISLRILTDLSTAAPRTGTVPSIPRQFKSAVPAPSHMFGRDAELDKITRILLHSNRPRIAILGLGGMGKTTLVLNALHEPDIQEKYRFRHFVSCEAVTTLESLLSEFADVLEVPPEARDANLFQTVISRLTQFDPVLLCLDNFETPWFESSSKRPFEELLRRLNSLPNLAILITMRGEERPSGVDWSLPPFPPLQPLSASSMAEVLERAANHQVDLNDVNLKRLMVEIEGLPLAATLLGNLLQDGIETPKSLWRRWSQESTKVLETDSSDRLYSLNRSISISLSSSTMQSCPAARTILSLFAFLPDGFSTSDLLMDSLNRHLPEDIDLRRGLVALRKVALVYIDPLSHRLRILPPIRRFCLSQLPLGHKMRRLVTKFYLELLDYHRNPSLSDSHVIIPPEMHNLQTLLLQVLDDAPDEYVFNAVATLTTWSVHLAIHSLDLVIHARKCSSTLATQAHMWFLEGWLAYYRSDFIQGELALKSSVEGYRSIADHEKEAKSLGQLSRLYQLQNRLEDAARVLREALSLNPPNWAKADILGSLGHVHLSLDQLDEAENTLQDAVRLHRQCQDPVGEANSLQGLGDLYIRRNQLDEAEKSFQEALRNYRLENKHLGEANALQRLGDLYINRDQLDEGEKFLQDALSLYREVQDRIGEASSRQRLADLYLRLGQLDKAEEFLQEALQLHLLSQDRLGEADNRGVLSDIHRLRGDFDKAEKSYHAALELHRLVPDAWGEGNDLQGLGELYIAMERFDDALEYIHKAIERHEKAGAVGSIQYDRHLLEQVRSKLEPR